MGAQPAATTRRDVVGRRPARATRLAASARSLLTVRAAISSASVLVLSSLAEPLLDVLVLAFALGAPGPLWHGGAPLVSRSSLVRPSRPRVTTPYAGRAIPTPRAAVTKERERHGSLGACGRTGDASRARSAGSAQRAEPRADARAARRARQARCRLRGRGGGGDGPGVLSRSRPVRDGRPRPRLLRRAV